MEQIEIVELQPSQWQEYRNLRLQALQKEPQAFCSTYEKNSKEPHNAWEKRLVAAAKGEAQWLVFAKQGNRLVGMVGAFLVDESTAEVIATYVAEEVRGKGVATKLMNYLLAKLKKNASVKKIIVEVNKTQTAALQLYLKHGFVIKTSQKMRLGDGNIYDVPLLEQIVK